MPSNYAAHLHRWKAIISNWKSSDLPSTIKISAQMQVAWRANKIFPGTHSENKCCQALYLPWQRPDFQKWDLSWSYWGIHNWGFCSDIWGHAGCRTWFSGLCVPSKSILKPIHLSWLALCLMCKHFLGVLLIHAIADFKSSLWNENCELSLIQTEKQMKLNVWHEPDATVTLKWHSGMRYVQDRWRWLLVYPEYHSCEHRKH